MKKSTTIFISAVALLAVAVSFDLGSKHSWLGQAMEKGRASLASEKKSPESSAGKAEVAPDKLRAEAREIWARMGRLDRGTVSEVLEKFYHENDPGKKYALLQSISITLTRQQFDAVLRSKVAKDHFLAELLKAWCRESPREALAWGYFMNTGIYLPTILPQIEPKVSDYLFIAFDTIPRGSPEWSAFLKESPDPMLAKFTELLGKEAEHPGYVWSQSEDAKIEGLAGDYFYHLLNNGDADGALLYLLKCPNQDLKRRSAVALALEQTPETLKRLAKTLAASDVDVSNLYLAFGGDSQASFIDAATYLLSEPNFFDGSYMQKLYDQWLKAGRIQDGLSQALGAVQVELLPIYFERAVQSPDFNESLVVRSMQAVDPGKRDRILVEFFFAEERGDHLAALNRIFHCPEIQDEVAATEQILQSWVRKSPANAAQWFQSLPNQQEHPELATLIADGLLRMDDAEAASQFVLDQGLSLDRISYAMAFILSERQISDSVEAKLMQRFQSEPGYEKLVLKIMTWPGSDDFGKSIRFAKKYYRGSWQTILVEDANSNFSANDSRTMKIIQALRGEDLSSVPPEKLKVYHENLRQLALMHPEFDPAAKNP